MNFIERLLEKLDDRINPIVVKELRQAVQGRFVSAILILFLISQMLAISYCLVATDAAVDFSVGRDVFTFLLFLLLGTCIVAIPAYAGFRFSSERTESDSDLLFITSITPASIIRGKFTASMALVILIYSACMPYMTITYLMRGIDLPSIFVVLVMSVLPVMTCLMLVIFFASLPIASVYRSSLGVLIFLQLLWIAVAAVTSLSEQLRVGVGSRIGTFAFWESFIGISMYLVFFFGLFYVLAVAAVSPPSANRALKVRLYLTFSWIIMGVVLGAAALYHKTYHPILLWMGQSIFALSMSFFVSICEREEIGNRIARSIPSGMLGRRLAFFYYSGSAGGIIWAWLHIIATVVIAKVCKDAFFPAVGTYQRDFFEFLEVFLGIAFYSFFYSMAAVFVRRYFLEGRVEPGQNWFLAIILAGLGGAVPYMLGLIISGSSKESEMLLLGNPFALGYSTHLREAGVCFSFVMSIALLFLNKSWIKEQMEKFVPRKSYNREVNESTENG